MVVQRPGFASMKGILECRCLRPDTNIHYAGYHNLRFSMVIPNIHLFHQNEESLS